MAFRRGGEWAEYDKAVNWVLMTICVAMLIGFIALILAMPLANIVGRGISKETLDASMKYIKIVLVRPDYLIDRYSYNFV